MKIERFEDIEAWQAARKLVQEVYRITKGIDFSKDYGLKDQIQRAAVSAMANIAEGFDDRSNQAFIQFLNYALRSVTEVQSHLYVALDQEYITQSNFDELYQQANRIKSIINGFIRYLKTSKFGYKT
ncbi:MAG: four helix bundle protein [Nitrospinae bacterium RIFCSPLOWO2_12_FULL_45_22]|nr:MAG: four helix bundle protein [Nitrospinae bacterium RIFCSPLOWO2_12_FULL_45_22]